MVFYDILYCIGAIKYHKTIAFITNYTQFKIQGEKMTSKEINYYLFSSNHKLAQKLYYLGNLKAVYCEKRHVNQDLVNFCGLRNIPLVMAEKLEELEDFLPDITTNSVGISYGIGFIFKQKHINLFEHGIWNIHPGKLPDNRGRHPIGWSFINNDKYFTLTIHSINEEIDQGKLIYEENIERDVNDDSHLISVKIDKLLEGEFLLTAIENYRKGNLISIQKGNYNKNLIGKFEDITLSQYSSAELYSVFKSQLIYGPLRVEGVLYDSCNFYSELLNSDNCKIVEANDGVKLSLHLAERR